MYHTALVYGELTVSAGAASLIIATGPVFTALLSFVFLGERLRPAGILGFSLALRGPCLSGWVRGVGCPLAPGPS